MAELPPQKSEDIWSLIKQLLQIISNARSLEYQILQQIGENSETETDLEQLSNITQNCRDRANRLFIIQMRVAEEPFSATGDMLELVDQSIEQGQLRIPAAIRSIEEIRNQWRL